MLRSLDQLEQVDASRAGGVFCSGSIGGELKFESPGTLSAKEFLEVSVLVFDGLLYAATCLVFLFVCAP